MDKKRIGILGSGSVGKALGVGFLGLGSEVKIGSREPEKLAGWVGEQGDRASAGTFAEAAAFGEILVVATLWSGTEHALRLADPKNFAGKVVIDVTNPLDAVEPGKPPRLAVANTDSAGEQVQRWLPGARVVKAFNTVGAALMVQPQFSGGPPDMFLCGDDEAAKKTVSEICTAFGWGTVDLGGITSARATEPLCILWVGYGIKTNTWHHAFKLLRK
jgi:predicted dinucleotide-binding enzyme